MLALVKFTFFVALVALSCEGISIPKEGVQPRFLEGLIRYRLYTRKDFRIGEPLSSDIDVIKASNLNNQDDTIIVVHGASGSYQSPFSQYTKDAIIRSGEYNVILVDWSALASIGALEIFAPQVGQTVGQFLEFLTTTEEEVEDPDSGSAQPISTNFLVNEEKIHLIGLGFGAHVAGIAGRSISGTVGRLTALDPTVWSSAAAVSTDVAQYLEVIHTDWSGPGASAIGEPIGHVDFYPNGNSNRQPGCTTNACNHERAWLLMESSIDNSGRLQGVRCANMADVNSNRCVGPTLIMGGLVIEKFASGIYRTATGSSYPF